MPLIKLRQRLSRQKESHRESAPQAVKHGKTTCTSLPSLFITSTPRPLGLKKTKAAHGVVQPCSGPVKGNLSLASFRKTFFPTSDTVLIHDIKTGKIIDHNQSFLRMFHLSPEESLKYSIEGISLGKSPFSQVEAVAKLQNAFKKGIETFEWVCRRRTDRKRLFWTQITFQRFTIDGCSRIISTVKDIDREKQKIRSFSKTLDKKLLPDWYVKQLKKGTCPDSSTTFRNMVSSSNASVTQFAEEQKKLFCSLLNTGKTVSEFFSPQFVSQVLHHSTPAPLPAQLDPAPHPGHDDDNKDFLPDASYSSEYSDSDHCSPQCSCLACFPEVSYIDEDFFSFVRSLPLPTQEQHGQRPPPPKMENGDTRYTLVLDLDETLVHCSTDVDSRADFSFNVHYNGISYKVFARKRPGLEDFLREIKKHYEIIVFTASQRAYAEKILDLIDPNKHISHRLYRESCLQMNGNFMKELSFLGRDLSKTIIIDNSPQAFAYNIENGIPIKSWYDDTEDYELSKVLPLLKKIQKNADVREFIKKYYNVELFENNYHRPLTNQHFIKVK